MTIEIHPAHALSRPFMAWTDYPMLHMGDASGQIAPIRKVEVHAYDGDKYAIVKVGGELVEMKRYYLYKRPRRSEMASADASRAELRRSLRDIDRWTISSSKFSRLRRQLVARNRRIAGRRAVA